jgi:hypothetical protein
MSISRIVIFAVTYILNAALLSGMHCTLAAFQPLFLTVCVISSCTFSNNQQLASRQFLQHGSLFQVKNMFSNLLKLQQNGARGGGSFLHNNLAHRRRKNLNLIYELLFSYDIFRSLVHFKLQFKYQARL